MKKIYPLALCLSLSTLAFSQQKPEFGFVVKVGNYAVPSKNKEVAPYYSTPTSNNTTTFKAGEAYSIGLWHSFPLNSLFRLSGEILCRFSAMTREQIFEIYWDGDTRSHETQKDKEIVLSLPIKLHYTFKKGGKTSFAIGGGISRSFSSTVYIQSKSESLQSPEFSRTYASTFINADAGSNRVNLSGGFYYRLDPKTSLGFEYTFERSTKSYYPYTLLPLNPNIDIAYYLPESKLIANMNSFSISLRHNILD